MGAETATHFLLAAGDALVIIDRAADGVTETYADDHRQDAQNNHARSGKCDLRRSKGSAQPAVETMINVGRVLLAADSFGAAEMVLQKAVAYAKDREQFNRPIASFQAVKHMCADMAARLGRSRSFVVCGIPKTTCPKRGRLWRVWRNRIFPKWANSSPAHQRSAWRHGLYRSHGPALLVQAHRV